MTPPISTTASALLFTSLFFTTITLSARLWITGLWSYRHHCPHKATSATNLDTIPLDLSSLPSIYNLLHHTCIFGSILLYSYVCENHPRYMHEEKGVYDRDEFLVWVIILIGMGVSSWKRNDGVDIQKSDQERSKNEKSAAATARRGVDAEEQTKSNQQLPLPTPENEVLNRHQTEEWKGWMQFIFLLYHYMHATEVYNGIRVLITCYVWLTGFGNFYFFHKTNDYSLPRLLQMLWRLNFLVVFLCLTHGNSYILYYICPLHTFYFLMVYAVMYIGKERNHTTGWIQFKLGVLGVIIFAVWDNNFGIFQGMHSFLFLGKESIPGAQYGTLWEWYFRSFLDHWSALLGMVFALNLPVVSLFYRKLEARSVGRQWIGKLSILAGMFYAFICWVNGPLMMDKEEYNLTNPYFGFVPLLLYVFVRNLTPNLRSHSMGLLQEIGKTTLETYAMQHHIWLSSNSKTVLVFIPDYPRLNMLLVTVTYIIISRKVYRLTMILRNILLPNNRQMCIRSITAMVIVISGFYFTAFVLTRLDLVSMVSVGILSVICGGLLYQTVMDSNWYEYHNSVKQSREGEDVDEVKTFADKSELSFSIAGDLDKESAVAKMCPPMVGVLCLVVLGSLWNEIVVSGATSVGPLPPKCATFANEGSWHRVDACSESNRAMAYRNHNAASFGMCSPRGSAYLWAWRKQPAHTHCRFGHRGEVKLRRMLEHRNLLFVGDSMTRNIYHASLRAMGEATAGAYDATIPKHTDLNQVMWKTTSVNFKWAPLAADQLSSLKGINNFASHGEVAPDMIIMGGGAWDRLHVYASDEDRKSHADTLKSLADLMKKTQELGISVIWVVPTTINSQALNTEEKRDHMREEDMQAMRTVYSLNGILSSASFVIDGTAFTASRVSESFDGVHYPHSIYDAGAQILFQSMDWLLAENSIGTSSAREVGSMSNAAYGMVLMSLLGIGLICHDGFLGFSYLACLFVKGVKPSDLHSNNPCADDVQIEQPTRKAQRHNRGQFRNHTSTQASIDENLLDEIQQLLPTAFDIKR